MDELSFFGSIGNPDPITDDLVDTVSPPELSPVESIDDDETLLLSMGMVQAWVAKKLVNVTFRSNRNPQFKIWREGVDGRKIA
jgi:hypothetical protein